MRLIDADELNKLKFHELPSTHIVPAGLLKLQIEAYERGWDDAIDAIMKGADTIDAVPVVRCKDCKFAHMTYGDFFCAFGKWMDESEAEP